MVAIRPLLLGRDRNDREVHLLQGDRKTATHIVGTSRRGKTKQVELLERQKIQHREGGLVIDPHGGLYQGIERWLAANPLLARRRKVRLIDPAAPDVRYGINPLHVSDEAHIADRVYAVMAAFSKMWGSENIERMPTYQRCFVGITYAIAAKGLTLVELPELIPAGRTDLRRFLASDLPDGVFNIVWEDFEVLQHSHRDWRSEFMSTFNRIVRFLTSEIIKETVGQTANIVDWRKSMDDGVFTVVNLQPRPGFSVDHARMLGRLIVHDLFDVALKRPADVSRPFFLTIDECADYLSDDIPRILPQTAKFGLHVTLIHQFLGQLKQESDFIYAGVMNQAPTKIVFGVSYADALELAPFLLAGEYDFEEPKHKLDKPVVTGYDITKLAGEAQGVSSMTGGAHTEGLSSGQSEAEHYNADRDTLLSCGSTGTVAASAADTTQWAITKSHVFSTTETFKPQLKVMATATYSKEEIAHKHAVELMNQPARHAMIRSSDPLRPTERYIVAEVGEGTKNQRRIDVLRRLLSERDGATTLQSVRSELAERRAKLIEPYLPEGGRQSPKQLVPEEPESFRE